jgi:outer membrane lipoprotein carrier protein
MKNATTSNKNRYKKENTRRRQPAPPPLSGVCLIMTVVMFFWTILIPVSAHTDTSRVTGDNTPSPASTLNVVLEKIEQRYAAPGFTADFIQESTLKMMQITDYARGTASFQRPGMMRWEYETPERQLIITDGEKLWIYKPDEKQVMLGKAVSLFTDGSGAEFLSDIRLLREKFRIERLPPPDDTHIALKMIPKKETVDLASVIIKILKKTYEVDCITSYNAYGDETRIRLFNIRFHQKLNNDRFRFTIPPDVDLLYLDDE